MSDDRPDFDWNHARAFLTTVEAGSLSAAARKARMTQPTLSRQVAALEASLGVTLFERVGKKLVLTNTGRDLVEHARAMAEAAGLLSLSASGSSQAVTGQVSITASDGIATYILPRLLGRLRERHPEIQLDLVVSNRIRDLRRREADIAIRHVRPDQPDLVAKKVRDSRVRLFASKKWINKHGRPRKPEDIKDKVIVGIDDPAQFLKALVDMGLPVTKANFKLSSDSLVAGWELVRAGHGIGVSFEEIGSLTKDVEMILPDLEPLVAPMWLCTHRELNTSRRIRLVFDFLAEELSQLSVSRRSASEIRERKQS